MKSPNNESACMNKVTHPTIHELYNSYNGGIPSCLESLARWLTETSIKDVLKELEIEYAAADNKRLRDCLYYLIEGISSIDQDEANTLITSISELLPELRKSNEDSDKRSELIKNAEDEWRLVAAEFRKLLADWRRWLFESEQLRLGEISTRNALRVYCNRRFNMFAFVPSVFDSPASFSSGYRFFLQIVDAINNSIERAHLANSLPSDLDVSQFHLAIKELKKRQAQYEKAVADDNQVKGGDYKIWDQYYQQTHALTQLLWRMKEAHLWSLFWLNHPNLMESAAV